MKWGTLFFALFEGLFGSEIAAAGVILRDWTIFALLTYYDMLRYNDIWGPAPSFLPNPPECDPWEIMLEAVYEYLLVDTIPKRSILE